MPFLGPTKAQLLAELIDECEPRTLLEVGTLAGYSAIVMSQAAGEDARVISIEKVPRQRHRTPNPTPVTDSLMLSTG
jgi:predicted O-methyltransferase YrrM